jgi:hypothetical protein
MNTRFGVHEIVEGCLFEDTVNHSLDHAPEHSDRAINVVCTRGFVAGMISAEGIVKKSASDNSYK